LQSKLTKYFPAIESPPGLSFFCRLPKEHIVKADSTEAIATTWSLTAGGVLLAQLHAILGVVVLVSSLAYTIWRWHRDIKSGK
jgi:hypothetical protein